MRKFKKNASWHFDWFLFPFWTGPLRGSLEIETEPTGFHVVAASMLALVFGSRTRKPQQFGPCLTSFRFSMDFVFRLSVAVRRRSSQDNAQYYSRQTFKPLPDKADNSL